MAIGAPYCIQYLLQQLARVRVQKSSFEPSLIHARVGFDPEARRILVGLSGCAQTHHTFIRQCAPLVCALGNKAVIGWRFSVCPGRADLRTPKAEVGRGNAARSRNAGEVAGQQALLLRQSKEGKLFISSLTKQRFYLVKTGFLNGSA